MNKSYRIIKIKKTIQKMSIFQLRVLRPILIRKVNLIILEKTSLFKGIDSNSERNPDNDYPDEEGSSEESGGYGSNEDEPYDY